MTSSIGSISPRMENQFYINELQQTMSNDLERQETAVKQVGDDIQEQESQSS